MDLVNKAKCSWTNDVIKVDGSFYCNLSMKDIDPIEMTSNSSSVRPLGHQYTHFNSMNSAKDDHSVHYRIYENVNLLQNGHRQEMAMETETLPTDLSNGNKTILKIGFENDPLSYHTIKLVIGEPLSLDTSEYVSWNGSDSDGNPLDRCHSVEEMELPDSTSDLPYDELANTCCQFFDRRQKSLEIWDSVQPTSTCVAVSLQNKMDHLRKEIVSLVKQDDALFRQLLALRTSISELRNQQCLATSSRTSLSPAVSASSLTSLTSLSDGEDTDDGQRESFLTRKRISYPPNSRNRGNSLNRTSFISQSSTWSTSSPSSEEDFKTGTTKLPGSPHCSFYSRIALASKNTKTDDELVIHKRQGSYDSGIQGSEPSDAEVFV